MKANVAPLALAVALSVGACASPGRVNAEDPFEGVNRQMYGFNDGLDRAVLEPVAKGYRAVTTRPIREGVVNFTNNLGEPATFANEVLQLKLHDAAGAAGRFVINTTIGVIGVFDPASSLGIARTSQDFGETLGVWGIKPGPYLVAPLLGSTDPRDLLGAGIDLLLNPISYVDFKGANTLRLSDIALSGLSAREGAIETIDTARQTQLDPYTTLRRFYVRNRATAVRNAARQPNAVEEVPDYEMNF